MNDTMFGLPSLPSLPSVGGMPKSFQVVTPFTKPNVEPFTPAKKDDVDLIIPLPAVAEKVEIPKPVKKAEKPATAKKPLPAKKLEKIQKKFDKPKAKTDHHWLPGRDEKTRPITAAKPAPKKAVPVKKSAPAKPAAKAKPVVKKVSKKK